MSKETLFALILFMTIMLAVTTFIGMLIGNFTGGILYVTNGYLKNGSPTLIYHGTTGTIAGGGSAFLVGVGWCIFMIRKAFEAESKSLNWIGIKAGVCAGIISTLILHSTLMIDCREWNLVAIFMTLLYGLPLGCVLGWLNGSVCTSMVKKIVAPLLPEDSTTETWLDRNYRPHIR